MLKLEESELMPKLTKRFQRWVKKVEGEPNTWLNYPGYYDLGVGLYQYSEALWQVFGRQAFVRRQEAHLDMASSAFAWTVESLDQGKWTDKRAHYGALRDRALAMKAVAEASWARLHGSDSNRKDSSDILAELIGQGDQPGEVVGRSTMRAQENPTVRHLSGVTNALAYRLNCGGRLGFLTQYNPNMAARLANDALRLLGDNANTLDRERTYRELRLDMALAFASEPDNTGPSKHYAELALASAKQSGDTDHARRAQLILRFGTLGNRLAHAITLLQNKQGKPMNRF